MRICLMVEGQEGVSWEQWVALARATEDAGLDGLFRSDHYRSIVRGEPAGALDAWATLAGLAAVTSRIRLGTMVSPVTFRRVSVLAKLVTTVDHISNGRVELGLGAGWYEAEHEAYGLAFPSQRERLDELDRQLAEVIGGNGRTTRSSSRSPCSSRGRRSSWVAPRSRGRCVLPSRTPTSTTLSGRRSTKPASGAGSSTMQRERRAASRSVSR